MGRVLVVDDELVVREGVRRILCGELSVDTSATGALALEMMQNDEYDLVITDVRMPGMNGFEVLSAVRISHPDVPVVIMTGYSSVDNAVEMMKAGAFDYIAKPFSPDVLLEKARRALEQRSLLVKMLAPKCPGFEMFVGDSQEMRIVYRRIGQVAKTDSTVLVVGESGTGKELVARAIHKTSPRLHQPFVAVDCTSLSENLLESELFGHVKGSFTGAVHAKPGLFKLADGGTLFLDEVANISLKIQAKLLRVLEERTITPVGGTEPLAVDIRLVAATNRDLSAMIQEGTFREDLYFRLNIIPIHLPPLRERKGDLNLLAAHFLKDRAEALGEDVAGLTPEAMALLERHCFPGNVRELKNLIERAVVLAGGECIRPEHLELEFGRRELNLDACVPKRAEELKETKRQIRERSTEHVEKAFVLSALERNNWNVTRAAEETGMVRQNFQALMKKVGVSVLGARAQG